MSARDSDNPEIAVVDNDTLGALMKILKELKKNNLYNAMAQDTEIANEDI